MRHRARKRFGQNFLQNQSIIQQILDAIRPDREDNILEIGPGLGALTRPLFDRVNSLTAVEIDKDLHDYLKALPEGKDKLNLIDADALTLDYSQFGNNLRIIGNLPYNISTPLILHLIDYASVIKDMHFMLQKEVVERIAASPGSKSYGRLSVMVQYHCEVEHLFNVPADAFDPMPKVESALIRLEPYASFPYDEVNKKSLESLVATAFSMRRKTLANNLKGVISADELSSLSIDPKRRPEQITIDEFVQIVKFVGN